MLLVRQASGTDACGRPQEVHGNVKQTQPKKRSGQTDDLSDQDQGSFGLKRVRDLGMPLISVSPVEPDRADMSDEYGKGV
jgi:hypothetical protein